MRRAQIVRADRTLIAGAGGDSPARTTVARDRSTARDPSRRDRRHRDERDRAAAARARRRASPAPTCGRTPLIDQLEARGRADRDRSPRARTSATRRPSSSSRRDRTRQPEFVAARRAAASTIVTRGEMLAQLIGARTTIAIAGTHGKTTTTAMIAHDLRAQPASIRRSPSAACASTRARNARARREARGSSPRATSRDGSFLRPAPDDRASSRTSRTITSPRDAELPRADRRSSRRSCKLPPTGARWSASTTPRARCIATQADAPVTRRSPRRRRRRSARARRSSTTTSARASTLRRRGVAAGRPSRCASRARSTCRTRSRRSPPRAPPGSRSSRSRARSRRFAACGAASRSSVARRAHASSTTTRTTRPRSRRRSAAARALSHGAPIIVAFQPHRYSRTHYLAADFAQRAARRRPRLSSRRSMPPPKRRCRA